MPVNNLLAPALQFVRQLASVRPREARLTVGLDIGSTMVKAVALGPRKASGARPLVAYSVAPISRTEQGVSQAIHEAMRALSLPVRAVNIAVSGQWVVIRIVEMPSMKPAEFAQAIPFEAQRYLPFNIQDVIVDGTLLGPSEAGKSWALIVACKKELIERRLQGLQQVGLSAAVVDVDALALANGFLAAGNGRQPERTHALVNVGAQLTNLVIFEQHVPYLVRDIPWGAEKLIRTIAEQGQYGDAAAIGQLLLGDTLPAGFADAVQQVCETLVTELQLCFDYFENRFGQPPEELSISGGLGQSVHFLRALKCHVTQTTASWTPAEGLSPQFAVAYGLALRSD